MSRPHGLRGNELRPRRGQNPQPPNPLHPTPNTQNSNHRTKTEIVFQPHLVKRPISRTSIYRNKYFGPASLARNRAFIISTETPHVPSVPYVPLVPPTQSVHSVKSVGKRRHLFRRVQGPEDIPSHKSYQSCPEESRRIPVQQNSRRSWRLGGKLKTRITISHTQTPIRCRIPRMCPENHSRRLG